MGIKKFFFVTLEGIDGAGKTTQAKIIAEKLAEKGYEVSTFREPGSTELGDEVRKLLFNKTLNLEGYTELFLFLAARSELISKVLANVKPGSIVIGDRFWDSTVAYQHYGKGLSLDVINQIKNTYPFNLMPDLTVWLDIPVDISVHREEGDSNISNHSILLLNKVVSGFKSLYENNPHRITKLNGAQEQATVTEQILKLVENKYNHYKSTAK
jgi:dTMP kinase